MPLPSRAVLLATLLAMPSMTRAGPPFVTDDPEPVEYGHWEIIGFATGAMTHGDSAGMLPGIEINHGALPNLQLHIAASVAYNSQSVTGTEFGYGDTTFGAKYRFIDPRDGDWWPQVAIYP